MKKNDLITTLGAIHAPEELIGRTMAKIEAKEARSANKSFFNFGVAPRVALAACALALVVGLGIYGGILNPPIEPSDSVRVASDDGVALLSMDREEENSYGVAEALSDFNIDELLAESENIDGDWAIVRGNTEACYFAGGEDSTSGIYCVIAVSLGGIESTSGGIAPAGKEMSFSLRFENESEMQEFLNKGSAEACFLIVADESDGDIAWTAQKFIFKN